MFTGLVESMAVVRRIEWTDSGIRLEIDTPLAGSLGGGDSIAVSGICLTALDPDERGLAADVTAETLARSTLGPLEEGQLVNVELPIRAGDPLGGHIVQGHVDGIGTVESSTQNGSSRTLRIACPKHLLRYVVEKGSIAVDGVSLTVTAVDDSGFTVALIPETLARTTLGRAGAGASVNLEVDVVAKYVEKLVSRA